MHPVLGIRECRLDHVIAGMCFGVRGEIRDDQSLILDRIECEPDQLGEFQQQILIRRARDFVG